MNGADKPASAYLRIEHLFNAVVEVEPDRREAFLLDAESDAAILDAVRRLLRAHRDGDDTLRDVLDLSMVTPAIPVAQIGAYRVIGELGSGGMGTVLLAERLLGDTLQRVALKLILGYPTLQARERLSRERSLLAGLNHPNIARLLDGGNTADNVPYLVMEYVDGCDLRDYCARHSLDLRARLRLFMPLCHAVQHAHQRLIVHRDIKPGNVLVREDGTPVLLDFGIGKILQSEIDSGQAQPTATRVYTPAYAAPEQIAGRAVTTATDIFGLGCVLHELLSDRPLYEVRVDDVVPAPSVVNVDVASRRALRGELDTLVGKAMHVEPDRRYASARALADDIENYLGGKPLHAAPDSVAYRVRKFVARHRLAVVAAAVGLLIAGFFVWRLDAERQRALQAEARAEREAQSTRRSRDFLVSLFEAAAPNNSLGHALSARELIDLGSAHLADELKDEPQTAARLSLTIAEVYGALGDPASAIASAERALTLASGTPAQAGLLRADVLSVLGSEYDNTERFDDARRADEEALVLRERFAPEDRGKIAAALSDLGAAAVRRGDDDTGRKYYERAMTEFAKYPDVAGPERSQVLRGLAEVDVNDGKLDASLLHAQAAVDVLASLPAGSPERIEAWRVLGRVQVARGEGAAAVENLEHALVVARAALGEHSNKVANVENDLAVALNAVGRYRDAIAHLEKSIDIVRSLRPNDRAAPAISVVNLGSLNESLGDYARAEKFMREGIAALEAETPDEPSIDFYRGNLARTLMLRGNLDEARAMIETSLRGMAAHDGEKSFAYAFQNFRRARIEFAAGQRDIAEKTLRDSVAVLDPLLPPQHRLRVQFAILRGQLARARGDLALAQREFEQARSVQTTLADADPVSLASARQYLAGVLLERGDLAAARRELDAALPVLQAALEPAAVELQSATKYANELAARELAARH